MADKAYIEVVWFPSHCGIQDNKKNDKAVNEGSTNSQNVAEIHIEAARSEIKRTPKCNQLAVNTTAEAYIKDGTKKYARSEQDLKDSNIKIQIAQN